MSRVFLRLVAAAVSASLVIAACGGDASDDPVVTTQPAPTTTATTQAPPEPEPEPDLVDAPGTLVEVAIQSGAFPTLVAAVQAAGLVDVLSGDGPFTVFAPTEEAFAAALEALGLSAEELLGNTELLTAVLTYHVLPLEAPADVVATLDGQAVATVNGAEITITIDGGTVSVNDATVIATDIEASNGIIHVIDTVLIPPDLVDAPGTLVEVAIQSGAFPTLVAAVQAAGLVDALSSDGPFTVFAPTEEAFAAALEALGLSAEDLLGNTELLTAVLTYHVLGVEAPAEVVATLDGQAVATLNGAEVAITIDAGTVRVNDAAVIATDIEASNGIIHVIDTVLIPPDLVDAPGTLVEVAIQSGAFPTLVAAVQAAGLVDVLSGDGPFTVFAPTEEAFAAALEALGLSAEELLGNTELLTAVLTYHVLPLEAPAEVVATLDGQAVATVNGAEITITIDAGTVRVNDATVIATDIEASNGIIHVIDTVLIPPSAG